MHVMASTISSADCTFAVEREVFVQLIQIQKMSMTRSHTLSDGKLELFLLEISSAEAKLGLTQGS